MQQRQKKLRQLYQLYEQPMYRIAYAILHQTQQAEDAVADAFLTVIQHWDTIGMPEAPETKAYMICVIRSAAIDQYRKNQREQLHCTALEETAFQIPDVQNDVETTVWERLPATAAGRLLTLLKPQDQELLRLRCIEEYSFREIAQQLHIRETTARKRFERIRKQLKKEGLHDATE